MIQRSKSRVATWLAVIFVGLPALYVGSFGQVADRLDHGDIPPQWGGPISTIYRPLIWAVNEGSPPIKSALFRLMVWTGYRMT